MLPKMNDKFAAFIEPARHSRGGLSLALILLLLFYAVFMAKILLFIVLLDVVLLGVDFPSAFVILITSLTDPTTPRDTIIGLSTFCAMLGAVWITTLILRRQNLCALVGPGPVLRNFGIAVLATVPIVLISFGLSLWFGEVHPNLSLGIWLVWMLPALPLLLIQVSSEELIFRGYFLQELAVRFKSRWVWIIVPSIFFGFLHHDPIRMGSNALLIVIVTIFFSIVATDVTVRTGNLGAAIGLHFINNLQSMMLLSLDGTPNGLSFYVTYTHVLDETSVRTIILSNLSFFAVAYFTYLLVIRSRERTLV
ncbi:MAG: CPBP family intramembrane metalloprotease [Amylibacter sp.]|nr:CPBP family intramembrane metalloprotease [Amylibacter sp.]